MALAESTLANALQTLLFGVMLRATAAISVLIKEQNSPEALSCLVLPKEQSQALHVAQHMWTT